MATVPIKPTPGGVYQDIPQSELSKLRADIFEQSKRSIPHLYLNTQVRIDDLLAVQKEINGKFPLFIHDAYCISQSIGFSHWIE